MKFTTTQIIVMVGLCLFVYFITVSLIDHAEEREICQNYGFDQYSISESLCYSYVERDCYITVSGYKQCKTDLVYENGERIEEIEEINRLII